MTTETAADFRARVLARTGQDLDTLPDAPAEALLGGEIIVERDGCYVVTTGYPVGEDEATGVPLYDAWGVVGRDRLA